MQQGSTQVVERNDSFLSNLRYKIVVVPTLLLYITSRGGVAEISSMQAQGLGRSMNPVGGVLINARSDPRMNLRLLLLALVAVILLVIVGLVTTNVPVRALISGAGAVVVNNCTLDLSCHHIYRNAHFHNIADCLLPAAAKLQGSLGAADVAARPVLCSGSKLAEYLRVLVPKATVLSADRCNCNSAAFSTDMHSDERYEAVAHGALSELLVASGIVDRRPALRRSSAIIWVRRLGHHRIVKHDARLLSALAARLGPITVYDGTISVRATIALFAGARAVVGYHGAGFVNAIFARPPRNLSVCLWEYSTFADLHGTTPWRSNCARLERTNPLVRCHVYRLPLEQLRAANPGQDDADIQNYDYVELSELDVIETAEGLVRCLGGDRGNS